MFLPIHTIHQFVLLKGNIYSICLMLLLQPLRKGDLRKDRCLRSCARVTCAKGSIFVAKGSIFVAKGHIFVAGKYICDLIIALAQLGSPLRRVPYRHLLLRRPLHRFSLVQAFPYAGRLFRFFEGFPLFRSFPCEGFPLRKFSLAQVCLAGNVVLVSLFISGILCTCNKEEVAQLQTPPLAYTKRSP